MTLLDRYLDAVRMFLPKDVRQTDVIEEIAEHLQSRMEEHCATLERPMTEAEQERLFNDYGSPMVVAGRYGGGTCRLRSAVC